MITSSTKVKINLDQWIKEMTNEKLPAVVKKHALNIAANASKDAPVDTGLLKNTLAGGAEPVDDRNWTISDGTDYGVFQELGTSRGVSAKHFLGGAAEREAEPFFNDVRKALEK
jgi:hypothetical protein